jgi:membrane-associated phospholipid phosphatase
MNELYREKYERHSSFFRKRAWAKKTLVVLNYGLTAAIFLAYAGLCIKMLAGLTTATAKETAKVFGIPLGCLIASSVIRKIINRPRPYEQGIEPVIKKNKKGNSFPSRHIASAFVIATVYLPYSVGLGVGLYIAGVILGYIRFAAGIHYPTDLLVGALIGAVFGVLIFL